MTYTDSGGLAVATTSGEALAAYEQGVERSLRWRSGALEALDTAVASDPQFTLAHCARAYIAWRMGQVTTFLDAHEQAMAGADDAHDERERLHTRLVDAMQHGDMLTAHDTLERLAEQYPMDRMALRLLSINYLARGDYQRGVLTARRSLAACPDDPQFLTMTAFFLEQSNQDPDEGLKLGLRSLARDPGNLYTYHAVGHNYQARGAYHKALETFERANSLERYAHLLWHLAEAQAILGDTRLTRDYWASSAPALPLYERIELQWRLEMLRHAPVDAAIWHDLAAQGEKLLENSDYLTVWMHHWIGLAFARAGKTELAQRQLTSLRHRPQGRPGGHWATLGADLLEGEMALIRGAYDTAAQLMAPAIERMHDMGGGSREQKDIFLDVYTELQRQRGNTDAVIALAQQRLQRNPNHVQSLAALAWAYAQTGQTERQRQTCQELLDRAAAEPMAADVPALQEARQMIC